MSLIPGILFSSLHKSLINDYRAEINYLETMSDTDFNTLVAKHYEMNRTIPYSTNFVDLNLNSTREEAIALWKDALRKLELVTDINELNTFNY